MAKELQTLRERTHQQVQRADIQQDRIDIAARELGEVSDRLQAAAKRTPSVGLSLVSG